MDDQPCKWQHRIAETFTEYLFRLDASPVERPTPLVLLPGKADDTGSRKGSRYGGEQTRRSS